MWENAVRGFKAGEGVWRQDVLWFIDFEGSLAGGVVDGLWDPGRLSMLS